MGLTSVRGLQMVNPTRGRIFIEWALHKVKKDVAPGKDEVILEMMLAEGLFGV